MGRAERIDQRRQGGAVDARVVWGEVGVVEEGGVAADPAAASRRATNGSCCQAKMNTLTRFTPNGGPLENISTFLLLSSAVLASS
jgi:hypothetical protein